MEVKKISYDYHLGRVYICNHCDFMNKFSANMFKHVKDEHNVENPKLELEDE